MLAAVGYRAGNRTFIGDTATEHSPANGLYRSNTGAPGSFTMLDTIYGDGTSPVGFARQERIGRTEMGAAIGDRQNHNFVYALVQDAVLFNGGVQGIDAPEQNELPGAANNTVFNGVYVSGDFGSTWTRMADDNELQSPLTESALIGTSQAMLYAPGVQSWYNEWIAPDPTRHTEAGIPTRLVFGLEEVWESRDSTAAQDGTTQGAEPVSFKVIGPYFADTTCLFLSLGLPMCPTSNTRLGVTTTHPDQQSGHLDPGRVGRRVARGRQRRRHLHAERRDRRRAVQGEVGQGCGARLPHPAAVRRRAGEGRHGVVRPAGQRQRQDHAGRPADHGPRW